ncbi:hypothetical protein [Maricaulis sp.]|uniref:hypothetical protein n=2 Tax=Maricaulis sp. TaxID=1486257 RepID=UPI003A93F086
MTTLCLAAGLMAGCGDSGTQSAQSTQADQIEDYAAAHGVDADVRTAPDGEVESVAIDQGMGQVGMNLDLPDGFPGDIPLYPGLNIYGASTIPGNGHSIAAMSEAEAGTVASWYSAQMPSEGWSEADAPQGVPGQTAMIFEKDNRRVMLTLTPGASGTTMSLVTLALG